MTGLRIVSIGDFIDVDEPGAEALLGEDGESALIAEDSDVMVYGTGGAGKTTLVIDLSCHLAAGDEWLGIAVGRPVNVLIVENEGPRPQFRAKLRRKRAAWRGSMIGTRIHILEEPWAILTLGNETHREALAAKIAELAIDVLVLGPITRSGMEAAGTLVETRDYMNTVADLRQRAGRPLTVILVHHESKSGQVSGAWEGAVDTLLHVQGQGHGRTRLFVQKARWSSTHHGVGYHLAWSDGESFHLAEPERTDDAVADEILQYVLEHGGCAWSAVDAAVPGKGERLRTIRDRLIAGHLLSNLGTDKRTKLWHTDDPSRPGWDDSGTTHPSRTGSSEREAEPSPVPPIEGRGRDDSLFSPAQTTSGNTP